MSDEDEQLLDAGEVGFRGWTRTMQKRFLPGADKYVSAGAWYGGGSKSVWWESTLEAIEETAEFQEEFAKSCSRRKESPEDIARYRRNQSPRSKPAPLLKRLLAPRPAGDPPLRQPPRRRGAVELPEPVERLRQLAAARPDDEAAHLVYADALLELGDAQGQLIADMCAGRVDEAPDALAQRILGRLARHSDFWMFDRGFPRYLWLRRTGVRELVTLTGLPEWEGVTTLRLAPTANRRGLPKQELLAMLTHPVMHTLREVHGLDQPTFLALCGLPLSLTGLGVDDREWSSSAEFPEPKLRPKRLSLRLNSSSKMNEWLWGAGRSMLSELESIELEGFSHEFDWLTATDLPRLRRVEIGAGMATREGAGWSVLFDPCTFPCTPDQRREELTSLPRQIERFVPYATKFVLCLPRMREAWLTAIRQATANVPTVYEHSTIPRAPRERA